MSDRSLIVFDYYSQQYGFGALRIARALVRERVIAWRCCESAALERIIETGDPGTLRDELTLLTLPLSVIYRPTTGQVW